MQFDIVCVTFIITGSYVILESHTDGKYADMISADIYATISLFFVYIFF